MIVYHDFTIPSLYLYTEREILQVMLADPKI